MKKIKLIEEAYKYVLLQRTSINKGDVENDYSNHISSDYDEIKAYLPESCHSIVDIGCGAAGIDIFLYHHYENPHIHLFDKTQVSDKVYYGFRNEGAFYNSLDIAKKVLVDNDVSSEFIHIHSVDDNKLDLNDNSVDFVISLFSWCFHYPVETYIHEVKRILKDDGIVIVDVRTKEKHQIDIFRDHFKFVNILSEGQSHLRVMCI